MLKGNLLFLLVFGVLATCFSYSVEIDCQKQAATKLLNKASFLKICSQYDINKNNKVESQDKNLLKAAVDEAKKQKPGNRSPASKCQNCDLNNDGVINQADIEQFDKFLK